MKPGLPPSTSVDDYIAAFAPAVQERLQAVRQTIRQAAPEAQERISYAIPTFTLRGNLVHFAAFKNHIGLYPGAAAIEAFRGDLQAWRTAKGTVRFPFGEPLPLALIARIVRFRVDQPSRQPRR